MNISFVSPALTHISQMIFLRMVLDELRGKITQWRKKREFNLGLVTVCQSARAPVGE